MGSGEGEGMLGLKPGRAWPNPSLNKNQDRSWMRRSGHPLQEAAELSTDNAGKLRVRSSR